MSKIAVIGTGYVGLTTGACLAGLGHDVVCADIDEAKVEMLSRGEVPILEAGLDQLVKEGLDGGRLSFVVGGATAASECEFAYLCVPTPQGADGSADLSYIESAATEIGPVLPSEAVVINKSTVPVGSTRVVERALGRSDIAVVSNPEFLREGSAVHDFNHPDRIVIGADDQSAAIRVASLYLGVTAPLIVTDPASAETIKYASNAFLATKISFVNAVAAVCEAVGADISDVVLGMGYDSRIGHEFLRPGPGWGGSCFVGDETVLVRRDGQVRLLRFDQLFEAVERDGAAGWEALAWRPGEPTPEFHTVERFTSRPFDGDAVTVTTKMGRRIVTTACHPFLVSDGVDDESTVRKLAGELTTDDWLPIAQWAPLVVDDGDRHEHILDCIGAAGIEPHQVIVRLDDLQHRLLVERRTQLPGARARDAIRSRTLRLDELRALSIPSARGRFGTTTNGTFVPDALPLDREMWRMLGLWLAEGHIGRDGARTRISWAFHPTEEPHLVDTVRSYWEAMGVKVSVHSGTTASIVSISSRLLAGWFEHGLGTGSTSYDKAIPDRIWSEPDDHKRALLRGLWDGDGSWSLVDGGPSLVLEYGTVSRRLADGMVRLLGDLGIVARLKVGRTAKSTVDRYWLVISGADQVERSLWLLPPAERAEVGRWTGAQTKRIAPTGYRRLTQKNVAWVRVRSAERRPYSGTVYSLSVRDAHTVVTSFGLVTSNCFPKDTRAMVRIAEDAGYDFDLLKGVVAVNEEQFERVADKIVELAGGSVDGVTVAAWGLTFKARTDDLRESPSLEVLRRLVERGARVRAYDPAVSGPLDGHDGIEVVDDPYAAVEGAEVLAVLTEWDEFRWLDLDKVAGLMAERRVMDARSLLDRPSLVRRGFEHRSIGRG
jgi:UDPglucose 6-dehydrogenase